METRARRDRVTVEPQAALVEFRHAQTQLCMAMVHALRAGKDWERVKRAGGKGGLIPHDRWLANIREARLRVNIRLDDAQRAGVTAEALIQTARQGRDTIEREWEILVPLGRGGAAR